MKIGKEERKLLIRLNLDNREDIGYNVEIRITIVKLTVGKSNW